MFIADFDRLLAGIDLDKAVLPDSMIHQRKRIALRVLPRDYIHEVNLLVRLAAGLEFRPEAHPYPVQIWIRRGTGDFVLGGTVHPYGPGDMFLVGRESPHGFCFVESETLFVKHASDTTPR